MQPLITGTQDPEGGKSVATLHTAVNDEEIVSSCHLAELTLISCTYRLSEAAAPVWRCLQCTSDMQQRDTFRICIIEIE